LSAAVFPRKTGPLEPAPVKSRISCAGKLASIVHHVVFERIPILGKAAAADLVQIKVGLRSRLNFETNKPMVAQDR
jgi:hypothetical protein